MTAIAIIPFEDGFHVVGDIALAGHEPSHRPIVPTIGPIDPIFPPGSGYVVHKLRSKVLLPVPGLAVAWADAAVPVSEMVHCLCEHPLITRADVQSGAARAMNVVGGRGTVLLGVVKIDGDWLAFEMQNGQFRWATQGEALSAGTGGAELLRACTNPNVFQAPPNDKEDETAPVFLGCCALLMAEMVGAPTLINYYGCGYEIAVAKGEQVRLLEWPPQVFYAVDPRENGFGLRVALISQQRYVDDRLIICTVQPSNGQWRKFVVEDPVNPLSAEECKRVEAMQFLFGGTHVVAYFLWPTGEIIIKMAGADKIRVEGTDEDVTVGNSAEFAREVWREFQTNKAAQAKFMVFP